MNEGLQKVVKGIDAITVAKKFLVRGFNVSPEAARLVSSFQDPELLISEICKISKNKFIICEEDVITVIKNLEKKVSQRLESKVAELKEEKIRILKDVNNSVVEGTIEDFVAYFNSRFEKLSGILRGRVQQTRIKDIGRFRGETINVVGVVSNVFNRKDNVLIELEDQTGVVNCIAMGKAAEVAKELLGDEVIAVTGTLKGSSIIVDRIVFPDCPINGEKKSIDFGIVFISDTHFGSKGFLKEKWKNFVDWLNMESKNEEMNKIAEKVKYLIVAGDIVDGVGIYPEQEKELVLIDIYEQYELAASHFDEIRKDIQIIISPGNHDAVRQAEPQPSLPKEISKIFSGNVKSVGNPSLLELEGLKILIYHGRSLDDIVTKIPRISYENPHKAMEELLKRRHLSPLYGGKSPIAPAKEDHLVIEEIPDVLHSGHVHTYGVGFYRGVFLVNSSTWQAQTGFQKKINLNPMPCNVAVYFGDGIYRINFNGG
ncbi:MAG: DNA-directed DNA polymerase II small subunit [Archaeoglobaceae archaeon]|nr:DNA-directed DNA polymerase II small subunit [Archaeoglobaceae archaeon]MDW7989514.1 DNA-directed DNA polymerase II small subunit [Archaeoglobaceae archaeon]